MARLPDRRGHFGVYGGRFVPETLMEPLIELERAYRAARRDRAFRSRLRELLRHYAGRPTPLYFAARLSEQYGGLGFSSSARISVTRAPTRSTTFSARRCSPARMGKERLIAETGAGQHGVATATAAALFGLACEVYMGDEDIERQALNVFRMRLLGGRVHPRAAGEPDVEGRHQRGAPGLGDQRATTYYLLGSAVGPHPYPMMVRDFHTVIGREVKPATGAAPDRPAPRCGRGLCGRWLQRDWPLPPLHRRPRCPHRRSGAGGSRNLHRADTGPP